MRLFRWGILALVLALVCVNPAHSDDFSETIDIYKKSDAAKPFFETCYGYAVFPAVGKAGIGIGGSYGSGRVYAQGVPTGTVKLFKGSIGFQLGGQAFSQMIFFEDKRAFDEFTGGNFEFDAGVSAVAITAGAHFVRKGGFLAALSLRYGFYLVWHIIWGGGIGLVRYFL